MRTVAAANALRRLQQDIDSPAVESIIDQGLAAPRATTSSGKPLTKHAAEDSLVRHGFKPPFGEVDDIISQAQWTARQTDGATVHTHNVAGRGRKYRVVIEGDEGIVTAMKNFAPHELRNLAKNNEFQRPW